MKERPELPKKRKNRGSGATAGPINPSKVTKVTGPQYLKQNEVNRITTALETLSWMGTIATGRTLEVPTDRVQHLCYTMQVENFGSILRFTFGSDPLPVTTQSAKKEVWTSKKHPAFHRHSPK
jgi:hypothetical protein